MSFDLQLPAARLVDHVDNDHLEKSNGWNLKESIQLKDCFHDGNVYSPEEVKLTLGIVDNPRMGSGKRTWYDKAAYSSSHHVIDLEEPTDIATNEDAKSVSTLSSSTVIMGDKHDAREPFQSIHVSKSNVEKELSHGPTVRDSLMVGSYSCEEQNSKKQGIKERYNDIESNFFFTEGKPFTSCEAIGLDLNSVPLDDSFYLSDPVVASLSKASSSGPSNELMGKIYEGTCPSAASWKKPNGDCFKEVSTLMDPLSDSNSSKTWASCTTFKGQSQNQASPTDLETESVHLSCISEDLNSDHREPGNRNVDFPTESLKGNYADVDIIEVSACRDGNIVEGENSNKSTISCKFDCNDDDSSSGTKTMQSGTDLGGSTISPCTQLQKSDLYKVAENESSQHESRSFDSSALKHQCYNKKEEQSSGGDALIQRAAELLIHFSLGSSTNDQDCCTKAASNGIKKEGRDQPQYSLDSYESIVLKLKESVVDDDCVSSKPVEVNEPDKKGIGVQMRRGRRLKDFQRDILPGLASLSAQEIQEDVNIMVAVIRSREYKRMRSKTAENCFAPVKSRRSRLNYVGRRYCS
ncbi:uncharacterized protein LOC127813933 isoform X2 [Diospyros lotus]|nr:uncharacterized protein LOC127813933 isoform X2 [Diospyros lotus]